MRISDWSSDVCSSDLDGVVQFLFLRQIIRDQIDVDARLSGNLAQRRTVHAFASKKLFCRGDDAFARTLFPFGREFRRSEEHPSELQSLMRISYAVFSLQKNKPLMPLLLIKTNHN